MKLPRNVSGATRKRRFDICGTTPCDSEVPMCVSRRRSTVNIMR